MSMARLELEISCWQELGQTPRLWWRDDDAVDVTPALDQLTALTGDQGIPVLLAVIPARASDALANHVALYRHFDPCVHGWAHENHEPTGVKRAELGHARPLEMVIADLARGHARLEVLFGNHLMPVLVPPWNRMRADLADHLPEAGLTGFSAFSHKLLAPDVQANTHVDVMDWTARRGKPAQVVLGQLADALALSRGNGFYEIGLLTHHLVHDETAWAVCQALTGLEGVAWVAFPGSTKSDDPGGAGQV